MHKRAEHRQGDFLFVSHLYWWQVSSFFFLHFHAWEKRKCKGKEPRTESRAASISLGGQQRTKGCSEQPEDRMTETLCWHWNRESSMSTEQVIKCTGQVKSKTGSLEIQIDLDQGQEMELPTYPACYRNLNILSIRCFVL